MAIDINSFVEVEESREAEIAEEGQIYNKLTFDFVNEELRRIARSQSVVGMSDDYRLALSLVCVCYVYPGSLEMASSPMPDV